MPKLEVDYGTSLHFCYSSILQTVGAEASRMGVNGPWITKSYLELILERKGWDLAT